MKVIGITGGVGAGKTSVISYIQKNYNVRVIVADELAKELEQRGNVCYDKLVKLLGNGILSDDCEIDSRKMAALMFGNASLIAAVNNIVHPAVREEIENIIAFEKNKKTVDFLFIEAALLIECGYKNILDELWYVRADADVRRLRLKESRGYTDEKIDQILANQLSDASFLANADYIIDNSGIVETAYRMVDDRLRYLYSL